jgi:hypothetical protein
MVVGMTMSFTTGIWRHGSIISVMAIVITFVLLIKYSSNRSVSGHARMATCFKKLLGAFPFTARMTYLNS